MDNKYLKNVNKETFIKCDFKIYEHIYRVGFKIITIVYSCEKMKI